MKTLIIHPDDPTTAFLTQIYATLQDKTVIKGGISKTELREMIAEHDRIFLLGHGSPWGLLSMDQFPFSGTYIIDDSLVDELKEKSRNLYIWCNADQFVRRHGLSGLHCGMFISEGMEALIYAYEDIDWATIEKANDIFALIVAKYIDEPLEVLYERLIYEYSLLARTNPIAKFNLERLYCNSSSPKKNLNKLAG